MKRLLLFVGVSLMALVGVASAQSYEQLLKAVPTGATANDNVGESVSMSGNRALVGAYTKGTGGEAFVYEWNGTTWTETKQLIPAGGASGDDFGYAVSISGDRLIVGAPGDDDGGSGAGAAYIYVWSGSDWVLSEKVIADDAVGGERLGYSVEIDGTRAIAGAVNAAGGGAAYIYEWSGSAWAETKVTASDAIAGDRFGESVSISGTRVIVGANSNDDAGNNSGAAYIYEWSGSAWDETKLTANDAAAGDQFGTEVGFSGDTAVVGASYKDDGATSDTGAVYIYKWSGSAWVETKVVDSEAAEYDNFGESIDINGDKMIIGSYYDETTGSASIYEWSGSAWVFVDKVFPSDGENYGYFGQSVAIDGDKVVVGSPYVNSNTGGAYFFAPSSPFLATFRTTTGNESITLPTITGYTYNFTVDWGDGSPTSDITSFDDADRVHSYVAAGDYQISITGSMPMWNFQDVAASKDRIISLDDAGDVGFGVGVTDMSDMFYFTSNLESVALFDTSSATSMHRMFYYTTSLTSVPLFDTSSVLDMSSMFSGSGITTIPLFDTSLVTNMDNMFSWNASLVSVPLLDTGSVTNMHSMFLGTTSLTSVPLFDTGEVLDMGEMFSLSGITSVPAFDTSSATDMNGMFSEATGITTVPLFDTSGVLDMGSMFYGATGLTSVPLFVTSAVTDMSYMFSATTSLTTVPLFDTSSVTSMSRMFEDATGLISVSLLDTSAVSSLNSIFSGATSVTQGALSGTQYTIDYSSTNMGYSALKDVLDNLGNANGGSQTITLTGNPGQPELTPSDCSGAEAKGWTVVPACTATAPSTSCTTYATTFFDIFNFYGSSSALTALGTYVYQYFYYDCESKSFQYGNESSALTTAPDTSSKQGTTTEIATINTNQTAEEGKNYYDTELGTFNTGASDGSLVTLTAPTGRILDATGIAAVSDADEGDFYFNTTTGEFHIAQANGSLAVLFTTN